MIERCSHLCQQCRIAVGVAGDEDPDLIHRTLCSQRAQRDPTFEAGPLGVGENCEEVVEQPGRVVAELVDKLPGLTQVLPGSQLWRELNTESYLFHVRALALGDGQCFIASGTSLINGFRSMAIHRYWGYFPRSISTAR